MTDCYYKVRQVLQNVADFVTKSVRYYKVRQLFNFAGFFDIFRITKCGKVILLQTWQIVITKCVRCYKVWQSVITKCVRYYKTWQTLLQSASTKYNSYYNVRRNTLLAIILQKLFINKVNFGRGIKSSKIAFAEAHV